jgi:hypothetical protein
VQAGGFSLHADIDIEPGQRQKLERLCRYVSRPPVAVDRMAITASGQVRYTLKTPYRDGTTHIVLAPLDLMARLAALVPPPRMHLTRYRGVFAPHSKLRSAVTPAGRGKGGKLQAEGDLEQADHTKTCGHELGTTTQARVRDRHRSLCALWGQAQDHCQHQGVGSHCEDPGAPYAHSAGAVQSAVSSKLRGRIRCRMTGGAGRGQCGRRAARRSSWPPDSRGGGQAMAGSGSP